MFLTKLKQIKQEIGIFLLFIFLRLPNLGYDMFNTDVWKWKQRIYDFGSGFFGFAFENTIQKYHPGVTLMWIGSVAVKFYNLWYRIFTGSNPPDNRIETVFELHMLQKLLVVVVIALTVSFIFFALKKLFNSKLAFFAVLLFMLEPFYFGLTRVIHLEGLMTTFMLASVIWFYYYLVKPCRKSFIISAVFASLAFLTKTSSLIILPFIGIVMFLEKFTENKDFLVSVKKSLTFYFKWLLPVILTFVLLWPAMWVAPHLALQEIAGGIFDTGVDQGHIQIFLGKLVMDPGPIYYFVVFWLRSSFYVLVATLLLPLLIKKLPSEQKKFVFYLFSFAVLCFIEMTIPSKKLDRYLLPTISTLSMVAGIFLYSFVAKLKNYSFLLVLPAFLTLAYIHPNYLSYYNPISGGLEKGIFLLEPKWTLGQTELVKYLEQIIVEDSLRGFEGESLQNLYYKKVLEEKLIVSFPEKYYTQLYPFLRLVDGWAVIEAFTPDAQQSGYFIFPVWDDYSSRIQRFKLEYRGSVMVRGVPIYNVYNKID